jgi:AcrR family transcriptional regulator
MARTYTLKRRAEKQADTRRRILEAAVDLHGSIGPALTNLSMVAERAGVQRHTLYAHFPDERSLFLACSGHAMERDPLPDPEPWRAIADPRARLKAGLTTIYDWYGRNADLAARILRDAEYHALTREMAALRQEPVIQAYREVLGAKLNAVALSFFTWRTLVRENGMRQADAVAAMVQATTGATA